jgi:hypothetical protein
LGKFSRNIQLTAPSFACETIPCLMR